MRLPRTRTLVIIAVVLVGAWFLMRPRRAALPWNVGQAGTIFQPGLKGGGQ